MTHQIRYKMSLMTRGFAYYLLIRYTPTSSSLMTRDFAYYLLIRYMRTSSHRDLGILP